MSESFTILVLSVNFFDDIRQETQQKGVLSTARGLFW